MAETVEDYVLNSPQGELVTSLVCTFDVCIAELSNWHLLFNFLFGGVGVNCLFL